MALNAQEFEENLRYNIEVDGEGEDMWEGPKPQREPKIRQLSEGRDINSETKNEFQSELPVNDSSALSELEAKYWGRQKESSVEIEEMTLNNSSVVGNSWNDPKPKREKRISGRGRQHSDEKSDEKVSDSVGYSEGQTFGIGNNLKSNDNGEVTLNQTSLEHAGSLLLQQLSSQGGNPTIILAEDLEKELLKGQDETSDFKSLNLPVEESSKDSSANISPKSASISPKEEVEGSSHKQRSLSADSTPKKKRKTTRRKMAANLPFLNDESVQLFNSSDWGKFAVKATSPEKIKITESKVSVQKVCLDSVSQVTSEDLRILTLVENGVDLKNEDSEQFVRLVSCQIRDLRESSVTSCDSNISSESDAWEKNGVLTVDRGTQLEESLTETEENLAFLQQGFPNIPPDHLKDILEQCGNDVHWASDLILDWRYNLTLSEEDNQNFIHALRKVIPKSPVNLASSQTSNRLSPTNVSHSASKTSKSPRLPVISKNHMSRQNSSGLKQPVSLVDLCIKYLDSERIVPKFDIERQLIASAQQRLDSMEKNIRINRQYSVSTTADEVFEDYDEVDDTLMQEFLAIAANEIQRYNETVDDFWKLPMAEAPKVTTTQNQENSMNGEIFEEERFHSADGMLIRQDSANEVGYKFVAPSVNKVDFQTSSVAEDNTHQLQNMSQQVNSVDALDASLVNISNNASEREDSSAIGNLHDGEEWNNDLNSSPMTGSQDSPQGLTLPLELPGDLTRALISLFGPVSKDSTCKFIYYKNLL